MNTTDEAATPVQTEVQDMTSLRVEDRCDRCIQQAAVRVSVSGFPLLFCAHDYKKHENALAIKGAIVLEDIRATIK